MRNLEIVNETKRQLKEYPLGEQNVEIDLPADVAAFFYVEGVARDMLIRDYIVECLRRYMETNPEG